MQSPPDAFAGNPNYNPNYENMREEDIMNQDAGENTAEKRMEFDSAYMAVSKALVKLTFHTVGG